MRSDLLTRKPEQGQWLEAALGSQCATHSQRCLHTIPVAASNEVVKFNGLLAKLDRYFL